jgi:hypothetical protein
MRYPRSCKLANFELAKNKSVLKNKDQFSGKKISSIFDRLSNLKSELIEPRVENERIKSTIESKNPASTNLFNNNEVISNSSEIVNNLPTIKVSNVNNIESFDSQITTDNVENLIKKDEKEKILPPVKYRRIKSKESLDSTENSNGANFSLSILNKDCIQSRKRLFKSPPIHLNMNTVQQNAFLSEHEFNALMNFNTYSPTEQVNLINK